MRLLSILLIVSSILFSNTLHAQGADSLLNFIDNNRDKSSIYLIKNDTIKAALNENNLMPLASTMKIMVALEFAKQAAFKVFDTGKMVSLNELNKYYLPLTDGNAHPRWIDHEKKAGHVIEDSVSLLNIARGMMIFSSNANTEYLMDLLGLQNINSNYRLMGIKNFTPLHYTVSSLFLYQVPQKQKEDRVLKEISDLSNEDYGKAAAMIHDQLKNNREYKAQFRLNDLTPVMQKKWSDRLPAATTKSYAQIMHTLNIRRIYSDETYAILSSVLESLMENPENQKWLQHAGMKGGSTMFVLTKSLYGTLKNGDKISLAFFFNDLEPGEGQKLQNWMNDFELEVLSNEDFVNKITRTLQ